jgi:hypothetical protein
MIHLSRHAASDSLPAPLVRAPRPPDGRRARGRRLAGLALCAMLALGLGGCGRGFVLTTPAGFAELEAGHDYAYRATNAEGVVIAVRRENNRPYGDLGFWAGAVDAHLRRDGYAADKAVEVQSADGVPGRQIRYHATRERREFVFWASVFVTEAKVVVVEAGGDRAHFDKLETAVGSSLASLEVG